MSATMRQEKSLGQLFSELTHETRQLIRQEIDLARTEVFQKAAFVGRNVAFMALGGLILYAGLLVILAALVMALAQALGQTTSAFIVGAIVIGAGIGLVMKGKNGLKAGKLAPEQTKRTLKETAEWAKDQVR
jgi:hypothetical protein